MSIKKKEYSGGRLKRRMALLWAAVLMAGNTPGLAADARAEGGEAAQDAAMGRYLEEEAALPGNCLSIERMRILEDGTLRVIYDGDGGVLYYADSSDAGESWGEPVSVIDLMGLDPENHYLGFPALDSDGGIFVSAGVSSGADSDSEESMSYYYINGEGTSRELDIKGANGFLYGGEFTGRGTILLDVLSAGLAEISLEDGSIVCWYEEGSAVDYFSPMGDAVLLCSGGKLLCYDMESGDPAEIPQPLEEDISSDESNLYIEGIGYYPVVFTQGDEPGSLFYTDKKGMYHYTSGGSVVEQIMDGSLNSVGSPSVTFVDMDSDQEGRFYLAVQDFERQPAARILRYEYSPDTPVVPSTELKIYSLADSELIHQAAALFQKKYPDIYLSVETGMTGEDAVTAADALRTLNTEIMADKGPDILMMDGIPADAYIQEGLLQDISGILKEIDDSEGLLPNIYSAYQQEDGSVYQMPVKFSIPMVQGHREDVERISDLKTLADVVESHEEEYVSGRVPFYQCYSSRMLLKGLSGVCAAAWMKEDGTLDEEAVKEYLTQAGRIYQSTESVRMELMAREAEYFEQSVAELEPAVAELSISTSGLSLLTKETLLGLGGLDSNSDLSLMYSAELKDDSLVSKVWDGQAKSVFYPRQVIGISAKTRKQEAAELFVKFLFSSEGQALGNSYGLPVNSTAYDSASCWQEGSPDDIQGVVTSINKETGTDLEMNIYDPSGERIEEVKALGTSLTVPSASNEIILSAVTDAGSRYLDGEVSMEEAVSEVARVVNLYLAE